MKLTLGQKAFLIWGHIKPESRDGLKNAGFDCLGEALSFFKQHRAEIIDRLGGNFKPWSWDAMLEKAL